MKGAHFLGTGTYTPETEEEAAQLYKDVQKVARATPAEAAAIRSAPGFEGDKGGGKDPTKDKKGR